ncbi:MAG: hypothetical protein WD295_04500 [Bacteroidota bacterium]
MLSIFLRNVSAFSAVMVAQPTPLQQAFSEFILGTGASRVKLDLRYEGRDVTEDFIATLGHHRFLKTTVADVDIGPGFRVPAFVIDDRVAYFGWVFWEKFTDRKMRKLWGSHIRNAKGDWAMQIPPTKATPIYANTQQVIEMEIDRITTQG